MVLVIKNSRTYFSTGKLKISIKIHNSVLAQGNLNPYSVRHGLVKRCAYEKDSRVSTNALSFARFLILGLTYFS